MFKVFDWENIGYVSPHEILFGFDRLGVWATYNDIDRILYWFDWDRDGVLSFGEFS